MRDDRGLHRAKYMRIKQREWIILCLFTIMNFKLQSIYPWVTKKKKKRVRGTRVHRYFYYNFPVNLS